jgi:hypothetical protein
VFIADELPDDPRKSPVGVVAAAGGPKHQSDPSSGAWCGELRKRDPAARRLDGHGTLRYQRHFQSTRHALHCGSQRRPPSSSGASPYRRSTDARTVWSPTSTLCESGVDREAVLEALKVAAIGSGVAQAIMTAETLSAVG